MELQASLIEQSYNCIVAEVNAFKDSLATKLHELKQTKESLMNQVKVEM